MSYNTNPMGAALDRYITGNYGEDQFKAEEQWEDFCEGVCSRCFMRLLNQCPVYPEYTDVCTCPTCTVWWEYELFDHAPEQDVIDATESDEFQRHFMEHCLILKHAEAVMHEADMLAEAAQAEDYYRNLEEQDPNGEIPWSTLVSVRTSDAQ